MWPADGDAGHEALLKDLVSEAAAPPPTSGMLQECSADFVRLRANAAARLQELREGTARHPWAEEVASVERALAEIESARKQVQVQLRVDASVAVGSSAARQAWEGRLQEWTKELAGLRMELEAVKTDHARMALRLVDARRRPEREVARPDAKAPGAATQEEAGTQRALETEAGGQDLAGGHPSRDLGGQARRCGPLGGSSEGAFRRTVGLAGWLAGRCRGLALGTVGVLSAASAAWGLYHLELPWRRETLMLGIGSLAAGVLAAHRLCPSRKRSTACATDQLL